MGAGISSIGRSPSSGDVKNILNVILREMFRRADLVDLYSLADPDRCSKYVVVASDALKKLFTSINLEPKSGPKGEIYFQKIEGIVKAAHMRAEQDNMCKKLAFFFIRIFQIYAALTLSVMDSDLPENEPALPSKTGSSDRKGLVVLSTPQLQGFAQPARRGFFGSGGALLPGAALVPGVAPVPGTVYGSGSYYLDEASPYSILNTYLVAPDRGDVNSAGDMRFQDFTSMAIPQASLYDFPGMPPAARGAVRAMKAFAQPPPAPPAAGAGPFVMYSFRNGDIQRVINATLLLNREGDVMTVRLDNTRLIPIAGADARPPKPSISGVLKYQHADDKNPIGGSNNNTTLPGVIKELFMKVFEELEPPVFSPVAFLKKYNIIKSTDVGPVQIPGTKITAIDLNARVEIPITYEDNMDVGDKEKVRVSIENISFTVNKIRRRLATEPQEYSVIINLDGLRTRPSELKAMIRSTRTGKDPTRRQRTFSTGMADSTAPLSERGETIPAFLQRAFESILSDLSEKEDRSDGGISYDKEGRPKPYDSEGVDEPFKIKRLWEALARNPPVKAHCVARATQLLNVRAIRDPSTGEAYSSACNVKFPYIVDGSLPTPGKAVTSEEGVYAMAMLFVDKLSNDTHMPQVTNTPEFTAFRKRLRFSFGRYASLEATPVPADDTMASVSERQMGFCRGRPDSRIRVEGGILRELRGKANELMAQQTVHVAAVMRLMFKLFDEKQVRSGALAINPNIMVGGMDAINKLAEEARNLLVKYYSDCEKTYNQGLMALYNKSTVAPGLEFVPNR